MSTVIFRNPKKTLKKPNRVTSPFPKNQKQIKKAFRTMKKKPVRQTTPAQSQLDQDIKRELSKLKTDLHEVSNTNHNPFSEVHPLAIRAKLEKLKGSARLDAFSIKNIDAVVNKLIVDALARSERQIIAVIGQRLQPQINNITQEILNRATRTVNTSGAITEADYFILATGDTMTLTLPAGSDGDTKSVKWLSSSPDSLTIQGTIDGQPNYVYEANKGTNSFIFHDGSWYVI